MPEQNDSGAVIQFDGGERNDRLVQGVILKCVDGRWRAHDDTPLAEGAQFFVFGITHGLQRWEDERVLEEIKKTPGVPLPDVDELNTKIPQETWDDGIDGKPRPPWQLNAVVYLLSTRDAAKFCFINSTVGAKIAAARLLDRVEAMRMLSGPTVIPIVELGSRMMKTAFGAKARPHFEVVGWRDLGTGTPVVPQSPPTLRLGTAVDPAKLGTPVKEPTPAEEFNDAVGF
jgi:hypothetical protein